MVLITILLFLFGCESLNSPGELEFEHSVLFHLIANKKSQDFYIYKSASTTDDISGELGNYFVRDAEVSIKNISWNYNNFVIQEAPYSPYDSKGFIYTNIDSLKVVPNSEYRLEISINDLEIEGTTIIPGDFEITNPQNNSVLTREELNTNSKKINIIWGKSNSAKGYIINVSYSYSYTYPVEYGDTTTYYGLDENSYITNDTSFVFELDYRGFGSLSIQIQAYDENYHKHIIERIPRIGIEGAYGYFGSSVLKTVTVNIK